MSCIPTNQELGLPTNASPEERRQAIAQLGGFQLLQTAQPQRTQSGGYKLTEHTPED